MRAALGVAVLGAAAAFAGPAAAQQRALESGVYRPDVVRAESISARGTTDLARLDVRRFDLPARGSLHHAATHDDVEELVIVTGGMLRVTLGGQARVLGPGSIALILPGDAHRLDVAGAEPLSCVVFRYRSRQPPDTARGRAAGGSFAVDWNAVPVETTTVGSRRNIFDRATTMFGRFEMHVSMLKAGLTNHAAHTHRAEEFVLMLQGDVRMLIGDGRFGASTGDLIFLASQIPHALDNTGAMPALYYAFQGQ